MSCDELDNLRKTAAATRLLLLEQQRRTREGTLQDRRTARRGPGDNGDMVIYLQRKLQRQAASIERHIAQHGCQR